MFIKIYHNQPQSENKLYLECVLSLTGFVFIFEFFHLEFRLYIPFFLNPTIPFFNKHLLFKKIDWPLRKDKVGIQHRYIELQTYLDETLPFGIKIQIPNAPVDHDPITFDLYLIADFNVTSYHQWHVCRCKKNGIERFPTETECEKYIKFQADLKRKMFGDISLLNYQGDKSYLNKFYSECETRYNKIPSKDK